MAMLGPGLDDDDGLTIVRRRICKVRYVVEPAVHVRIELVGKKGLLRVFVWQGDKASLAMSAKHPRAFATLANQG
jgi:hypothetical protein